MTEKTGTHRRNTRAMRQSPRCGAKTRTGGKCEGPAVSDKARCRMHGGAKGSGAPKGNRNALKHGLYPECSGQEAQQALGPRERSRPRQWQRDDK